MFIIFSINIKQTLTDLEEISRVLIFALCDIDSGTELRYDYGGGSALPWRQVISTYFCKFIIYVYSIQLIVA